MSQDRPRRLVNCLDAARLTLAGGWYRPCARPSPPPPRTRPPPPPTTCPASSPGLDRRAIPAGLTRLSASPSPGTGFISDTDQTGRCRQHFRERPCRYPLWNSHLHVLTCTLRNSAVPVANGGAPSATPATPAFLSRGFSRSGLTLEEKILTNCAANFLPLRPE